MTTNTTALVQRLRDALGAAMGDLVEPRATWGLGAVHAASAAIAAADQWLAEQPVQAVAQPLTDEQILDCVRSVGVPAPMGLTRDRGPYEITEPSWFLTQLVHAIERAHGIGQPGATK